MGVDNKRYCSLKLKTCSLRPWYWPYRVHCCALNQPFCAFGYHCYQLEWFQLWLYEICVTTLKYLQYGTIILSQNSARTPSKNKFSFKKKKSAQFTLIAWHRFDFLTDIVWKILKMIESDICRDLTASILNRCQPTKGQISEIKFNHTCGWPWIHEICPFREDLWLPCTQKLCMNSAYSYSKATHNSDVCSTYIVALYCYLSLEHYQK